MRLNAILAKRAAVKAARDARLIARSTRPLPRYPDAAQSLKIYIVKG